MKTQNTSATTRRPQLLGKQIHNSMRTSVTTNVDADGRTTRTLQTSCLEVNWISGEAVIRFTGSRVEMAKAGA
ncbi:hypothetical protein ACCQ08_25520 [Comamonas sp. SY3]|uniref:hypothetical protein n=1 Tax=Comamonas sp. SY3 TaxID=3243601 RepID=UPI00359439AD